MPRITLQAESKRFKLESLPPDGYVVIRALTYGQSLERRQLATRLSMEQQARSNPRQRQQADGDSKPQKPQPPSRMDIDIMQRASREFEFANCIIEHNIEGPDGSPLNFNNPRSIQLLPKDLGEEIESYLDEMNGEEEAAEDLAPFKSQSTQSSPEEIEESVTKSD